MNDGKGLDKVTHERLAQSSGRWIHPLLPADPVTIAGKDGDDAPCYLEKRVNQALLQQIQEEE